MSKKTTNKSGRWGEILFGVAQKTDYQSAV